ncbi:MAG TPA: hypothetical protein V6C84_14320 [Coleofasciculaceae cyanobacterium]|jgi:hypothetical protein
MELQDREVTLKLKTRPLRCAYLVRDREDLLNAIALYTHLWGGCANAILPIPNNDEEINRFISTLEWMNPDCIFIPREGISIQMSQVLESLPSLKRLISKEEVEQHINSTGNNQLRLPSGSLSHIGVILSAIYQNPLEKSNIYFVRPYKKFNLEIALHLGQPSETYLNYLIEHLGANFILPPKNIELLIKTFLVTTKFLNPSTLTLLSTTQSHNLLLSPYLIETNDPETLCLFLDDGQDLGIATAFWNCRWIFPRNKVFLPREEFLRDVKAYALQIVTFMPYIRALHVTTPCNSEEALDLYSYLKSAFTDAGRELSVKVNYRDFSFDWIPGTLFSGKTADFTRAITSEGCIRFDPSVPIGHEKTNFIIGYDAEVKFISGRHFFTPKTLTNSHLLTNELWRLEYSEENKDNLGELWLKRDLPVRAGIKGISGLALPGKECSFYIHSDHIVITQHLKDVGLELKPNQHTRYAQGLVKRFGGLEEVLSLMNDGGFNILSAFASRRTASRGFYRENIINYLQKAHSFSEKEANNLLNQKLKSLLASGLIRRGYSLKCPHCNLLNWFLLKEIGEFLECRGCAENFQLPLNGIEFTYESNELATQLIHEGGLAVLMTAASLKRILDSRSSFIQFGGDLFPTGSKINTNEVDLFWLTEDAFIIAECKSFFDLSTQQDKQKLEKRIEEIKNSLTKNVDLAKRINAKAVILGIATNLSEMPKLFDFLPELVKMAKDQGIGLHLALNEKIHLMGSMNGVDPRNIKLNNLLVDKEALLDDWSVGESPNHYGGAVGSNGLFDEETLKQWKLELENQV